MTGQFHALRKQTPVPAEYKTGKATKISPNMVAKRKIPAPASNQIPTEQNADSHLTDFSITTLLLLTS
jgi:hypothetical protein